MHKLDPIERLPDGTLFRLTPGQLRSVRGLAKRCCNFLDGDCRLREINCGQTPSSSRQSPSKKLQQRFASPRLLR